MVKPTPVGYLVTFTFLAAAGIQLTLAQQGPVTSCTNIATGLNTRSIQPVTVPDLPVCVDERAAPQCCSADFIRGELNETEDDFIGGLRDQLQDRFNKFEEIANQLRQYLEGEFLTGYFASIGDLSLLGGGSDLINDFIADFKENLEFDPRDDDANMGDPDSGSDDEETTDGGFSIRAFLRNVTSQLEERAVSALSQNSQLVQCIRRVVENRISAQKMQAQAEALQQIRRVVASIESLRSFIRNFTNDLAGFRPLQQCVDRMVELNICGRCVAVRPTFCRNVCLAVARACYSPFNDALEDQLEVLWEVVRRILQSATEAIEDLNENSGFLDIGSLALQAAIGTECGVGMSTSSPPQRKRQAGDDDDDDDIPTLPAVISNIARALRGGPFDDDDDDVIREGLGICRRLTLARANCWDGENERSTDIDDFDFDDIDNQVNNPAITLDTAELRQQATSLGTPVTAALSAPSFAQVAPQGLVIPLPGSDNGATSVALSFTLFTLALVAGISVM